MAGGWQNSGWDRDGDRDEDGDDSARQGTELNKRLKEGQGMGTGTRTGSPGHAAETEGCSSSRHPPSRQRGRRLTPASAFRTGTCGQATSVTVSPCPHHLHITVTPCPHILLSWNLVTPSPHVLVTLSLSLHMPVSPCHPITPCHLHLHHPASSLPPVPIILFPNILITLKPVTLSPCHPLVPGDFVQEQSRNVTPHHHPWWFNPQNKKFWGPHPTWL